MGEYRVSGSNAAVDATLDAAKGGFAAWKITVSVVAGLVIIEVLVAVALYFFVIRPVLALASKEEEAGGYDLSCAYLRKLNELRNSSANQRVKLNNSTIIPYSTIIPSESFDQEQVSMLRGFIDKCLTRDYVYKAEDLEGIDINNFQTCNLKTVPDPDGNDNLKTWKAIVTLINDLKEDDTRDSAITNFRSSIAQIAYGPKL